PGISRETPCLLRQRHLTGITACFLINSVPSLYCHCTEVGQNNISDGIFVSCAFLLSVVNTFLLSISISLCFLLISRCRNAHLSSTSLEISITAAFTSTSMIEESCV
uniref:Uncharacterized protein n=1 Tax=Cynoglossus semilaevis TaxID=244447 RepID=A0A3P8X303_CYNSE